MKTRLVGSIVFAAAALVGVQGGALAAPCVGTGYNLQTKVTTASDCYIAVADKDKLGSKPAAYTVNTEKFFTYTDWSYDGKYEKKLEEPPSLVDFTGDFANFVAGSYALTEAAKQYQHIMFVFKSHDNIVAYLLNSTAAPGDYGNPFTNPPFDFKVASQDISHISVYFRGMAVVDPVGDVPEPASLALLGLGMAGMLAMRRRKPAA